MLFAHQLGDGLTLRLPQERDAPAMFAAIEASRETLRPWMPWELATQSPEDILPFIRSCREQYAQGNGPQCSIWEHDAVIGGIGLHPIDWTNRQVSLGYWLRSDREGRGIITRCTRVLLVYCFDELELERVWLEAAAGNQRSRAVALRLGMTEEGTLRSARVVNGVRHDMVVYSLLRLEWLRQQADPA